MYDFSIRRVVFQNKNEGRFGSEVRRRVDDYFIEEGISKNWNVSMLTKTVCLLMAYVLGIIALFVFHFDTLSSIALLMLIGCLTACIGFNVAHDATHGSYSSNPTVNAFLRHSFELIGASSYTWNLSHNIVHHTYTNVIGVDRDLESVSMLRFYAQPDPRWFHRYQHWYCLVLYCLTSAVWVLKKDFQQISDGSLRRLIGKPHPRSAFITLFISKLIHYAFFLILPVMLLDWSVLRAVSGFFLLHAVAGLMLAVVFQLAHAVEGPIMIPKGVSEISDSWMEYQMKTTSNFAKDSHVVNWICGGLNFQIEHHLFPKICHIHYPAIAPIVRRVALEFDVPYHEHRTFFLALRSHLRLMRRFGVAEA